MTALAEIRESQRPAYKPSERLDPVTVETIRMRLLGIADQVDLNIERTAFSTLVYEYKDYAVGIVDADANLLCQCNGGMPIFVADTLSAAVREGLRIYGADDLHDGDVIITNRADTIGQHLNNVTMYTPIRDASGNELIGFFVVVMHWIDIGGRAIGSVSMQATDVFQEGIQFNAVKLQSRGKPVAEMYRMIEANTRFAEEVMGDIASQVGGCLMGRDEVRALVGKYGLEVFRQAVACIYDQSELAARHTISTIPDGTYVATGALDDDGIHVGQTIPLTVKVIVAGDEMTVDLSELPPEVKAPINSGRSGGAQSVARLAFRYLIVPEDSANEGSFRPLSLKLREGSMVTASPNAPRGQYNVPLPTLIDLVMKALAPALPDRVAGGHYGTFSTVRFTGRYAETGEFFQCADSAFGGWGALSGQDGPGPFRTMCHGGTRIIPVEVQEAAYPILIEEFCFRTDSGGAGEYRGGLGLRRRYLVRATCEMWTTFDRTKCPPWGIHGGLNALPGGAEVIKADGTRRTTLKTTMILDSGDRVIIDTGGGGGYGPPRQRNLDHLREDVSSGYVSQEAARALYGYELD